MKKRILAAVLAVAMVFSVCTAASAAWVQKEGTEVLASWDMEESRPTHGGGFGSDMTLVEGEGVDGSKALKSNGGWAVTPFDTVLFTAEAGKTYEISVWFKGALYQAIAWIGNVHAGSEMKVERAGAISVADWQEVKFIVSGVAAGSSVGLNFQDGTGPMWIDNISVYEVEEVADSVPTPTPDVDDDDDNNNDNNDDNDPAGDDTAKILCIGDSITHGNGLEKSYFTSYRYPLWKKLIDAGVDFEMVGPRDGNFNKNCTFEEYKGQTFNNKHYAQYGVKLEAMKGTIGTDCADIDFDIAIINLGTNDRKTNSDTEIAWTNENLPNWLAEMTNTLRTINPNVTVFLAGLNDNWPGTLNGHIEAKAEEISTTESPVYYIPAPAGWIADPDNANTATLDWVHPNEKGDNMMADAYFNALMENYFNATFEPTVTESPAPVDGTPVATPAPVDGTPVPTVTPSAGTTDPTVSPSTGTTKKKVTIKFKKKSVKIKKGKKVTLKVTIKNAKKAKFSVDKKGKKVVKLSKKKAKSVVVTGKKKGKATITAKAGSKKATCKVKVK